MRQLFLIAFRNLVQHSKRTLLLGGAIAVVTALLVFLMCLSCGVRATMIESGTTLSTGHINVAGFYKVTAGQSAPLVTDYKKVEAIVRSTLDDIDYLSMRGRGWARVISDSGSMQVAIGGIDIDHEPGFRRVVKVSQGKIEDLKQPNTVLLFEKQAKKLDVHVGDTLILSVLTPRGVNNTIDLRVAAIAQDIGILSSFNIFIPEPSIEQLYQLKSDSIGAIHIYLKNMNHIPQDMDKLRQALSAAGYVLMDPQSVPFWQKFESVNREDWTGQKLDLTTWEDELSFIRWSSSVVDGLTFVLTIVLLTIIAIGIMNSMWIAIRERTREIGTLRAIGMQRLRVMAMFLIESFTLGALGTLAGAVSGLGFALVLNSAKVPVPEGAQFFLMSTTLKFTVEIGRIVLGMAVITGSTTLISLIPSWHAARLKPITAMQHIG